MVAEQQQSDSSAESSGLSKPEHRYRFKDGALIAHRFKVSATLGFGGFAEVYRCEDLQLDSDVAVKVLTEGGVGFKEARAAAQLRHPNIVRVTNVSTSEDEIPFIVFDYVAGETLEECLARQRRLPLDKDTLRIIQQVSDALDYAHEHKVIHRDIKPSNIMLDSRGNAYLTDFGLAEVKGPPPPVTGDPRSMLTSTIREHLSGTIPYMAPEQFTEGKPGDERSDLYSLGVVVYKMLTGQFPYQGQDTVLIAQIIARDPIPPIQANNELPKGIEPVLLRALDKVPQKRYPTCLEFATDLRKAAQAHLEANDRYEQARKFLEGGQWQLALSAFETLRHEVPGFKDTEIRKFELHGIAQKAVNEAKYQDALDALNNLAVLDPNYDVTDLRQWACDGLAQQIRQTLDEQYRKAIEHFRKKEYQACLDAWCVIRNQDPAYSDTHGIEAPAQAEVEKQKRLHELYERGIEHMDRKQWKDAIDTFEALKQESPDYKDIDEKLASAHHLALVSSLLSQAKTLLDQGEFADCIDRLDELQRKDKTFRSLEVISLRQEALNRLHGHSARQLQEGRFRESLAALAELRQRSPDFPGIQELETQAREEIQLGDLRAKLDSLYQEAIAHLSKRAYAEALECWQEIQLRKESLDYPDPRDVEARAKDGLCMNLYGRAAGALGQRNPQLALELWRKICDLDSTYPDNQQVEECARTMQREMDEEAQSRQEAEERAQAMYTQAVESLNQRNPQQALELWHKVREVDSNYPDSQQVEARAQAMSRPTLAVLAQRTRQRASQLWRKLSESEPRHPASHQLEAHAGTMQHETEQPQAQGGTGGRAQAMYSQAAESLNQRDPLQALELWCKVRELDPDCPDDQHVEERARALQREMDEQAIAQREAAECTRLMYSQAVDALAQRNPQQALEFLRKVYEIDPNYPDDQQIEERAQAMQREIEEQAQVQPDRAAQLKVQQEKTRRLVAILGGVATVLVVLGILAALLGPRIFPAGVLPTPTRSTFTPIPIPTNTRLPTATVVMPTVEPTLPPTPVLTAPAPASNIATARQSSSIYAAPNSNSQEWGVVQAGEQVTVTGRAAPEYANWLYVRSNKRTEGFVYIPRFVWSGNVESLPIVTPSVPISSPPTSGCTPSSGGQLTMDLWPFEGGATCVGEEWYQPAYIAGHGGNGCYTFYWNEEKINCPASWECTFRVRGKGGTATGKGRVVSGDGQQIEQTIFVPAPDSCRRSQPTPTP